MRCTFEGFYRICLLINLAFGKWRYFIFSLPLSLCKLMVLGPCNLCSKCSDVARLRRKQAMPATKLSVPATNFIQRLVRLVNKRKLKKSTHKSGSKITLYLSFEVFATMHRKSV